MLVLSATTGRRRDGIGGELVDVEDLAQRRRRSELAEWTVVKNQSSSATEGLAGWLVAVATLIYVGG